MQRTKSGTPAVFRGTSLGLTPILVRLADGLPSTDGRKRVLCNWLSIRNQDSADPLWVYLHEEHADAGAPYIEVDAVGGVWSAFIETDNIWVAAGANTISAYDIVASIVQ